MCIRDSYHYRYESGREGDMAAAGFSSRKPDLVVYLVADTPRQADLFARLGSHRRGTSCLYFRRLADVDTDVLRALVDDSYREVQRLHPNA